jgi:8-oxo-dGTP pyrophosphatase MutT (NUDIX family)
MLPGNVELLQKVPEHIRGPMKVDEENRTVCAFYQSTLDERSAAVAKTMEYWKGIGIWSKLSDETWDVHSSEPGPLYTVNRTGAGILGTMHYGVHMTCYVKGSNGPFDMKIWVAERKSTKAAWPGWLDNTVAGGLPNHLSPVDGILEEAFEEASLDRAKLRRNLGSPHTLTFMHVADEHAGKGEVGLIYPEVQYIFECELPSDMAPRTNPDDNEVESFKLCTVDEVKAQLLNGRYKPNCALILVDFLIRKGIITREDERDYDEIIERMNRDLPFVIQPIKNSPGVP